MNVLVEPLIEVTPVPIDAPKPMVLPVTATVPWPVPIVQVMPA